MTENLLAGKQREPRFSGFAFCQRTSSIERYASELYEKFDIRGAGVDAKAGSMSGGNMQKVVIAREFSFDAPVLLIAQPTRGVDVGAIEFIHARILEKRNEAVPSCCARPIWTRCSACPTASSRCMRAGSRANSPLRRSPARRSAIA